MSYREKISDSELGERLRVARESAKTTQAAAAKAINVARTTIVAIEQGQRRVRPDELQQLARLYNTSVNSILRKEAVHIDLVPRFRKLVSSEDNAIEKSIKLLHDLVAAELELETVLAVDRPRNYPPERPILPGDVRNQAELDAQELRDWLGLGGGAIFDIVSILDLQLGVRVYVRQLDSSVSGLFAYDEQAGACMLLNANHPAERLKNTGAHELAHFVSTRREPEVLVVVENTSSREEKYANHFARCFLTPGRAVRQRFAEITAGQSHLTRRHIILLAHSFGVSREAMCRRLEELKLAKSGTWDWFVANGGITNEQVKQVLGVDPEKSHDFSAAQGPVPPRLGLLAREAWRKGLYSEGQLARLLGVTRCETRLILDGAEQEENEANELFKLS
ncbi:XRE family transcriptional regulator [Geomonas paludis]|uniref:HTH cro/C1-type domain-containing protein n=1 Tax=Geomonas paludis TaxID=2740185 RepID=A0A6V8MSN4_9BACT|nr:XRE family transcriptional regulator [Geomonas paludis]GFO63158.1 hypothetical protein GMPD_10770 [Geomonas paludis]